MELVMMPETTKVPQPQYPLVNNFWIIDMSRKMSMVGSTMLNMNNFMEGVTES